MLRLITDVSVIRDNIASVKKRTRGSLIFMVKADAYNHGIAVASAVEQDVDGFGVSCVSEGAAIRLSGVKKPIQSPVYFLSDLKIAKEYDLLPVISDPALLLNQKKNCDVKINVGMNRYGFSTEALAELLSQHPECNEKIRTIHAHLSCISAKENDLQAKKARDFALRIGLPLSLGGGAATTQVCDEYRVGLMLYGYGEGVRPALTVTTFVSAVQTLEKGEKIGYSGLFTMPQCGKIAILQAGYYDGLSRKCVGNKVKINGLQYEIVGNICMDCCFAYVGRDSVSVGDTAVILDSDNDAEAIARELGTIPYEVLTSYKGRIERYLYDEKRTAQNAKTDSIGVDAKK